LETLGSCCHRQVAHRWASDDDDMVSDEIPDGPVKVDDMEVQVAVPECGKLSDNEFSIPSKLF